VSGPAYIWKRILLLGPVLFGLTLLTFGISHVLPGDPALLAAGPQATPQMVAQIREEFGLDRPWPVQYVRYVGGLLTGEWGRSILSRRPVSEDLQVYWPATLELVTVAMVIAVMVGILLGVSLPAFCLALLLQWFISYKIGILPTGSRFDTDVAAPRQITGFLLLDSLLALDLAALGSALRHLVLPALTLSMAPLATVTRMTRSSLLEELARDYVRTARAKGLGEQAVLFVHALRNAGLPTLTMIGLSLGWLLGGSVLVETIFDWPGIGLYAVKSALTLDFMPIMGLTIIYGVLFSLINLLVDVLYAVLDPRLRLA
jgi:peptide/nickel transport system permease protein